MDKISVLDFLNKKSNQYYMSEKIFGILLEKKIFDSYGKKQYRKNKFSNNSNYYLYKELKIDTLKYNSFFDVCSNPNNHSIYLMNSNKKIKGVGISLGIDKGGYPPNPEIDKYKDRYEIIYYDLLTDNKKKLQSLKKFDYALSDCFIKHNRILLNNKLNFFNKLLQYNSLDLILSLLKPGGDMIYLLPFQFDPIFFLNFLFLLYQIFEKNTIYKSKDYYPDLAIVFIYSEKYNPDFDKKYLNEIKEKEIIFNNDFLEEHINDIDYIYKIINIGLIKSIKKNN